MTRRVFTVALAGLVLGGCHTVPTADTVYAAAQAAGAAAALVMNETKFGAEKRTVIRDIVVEVRTCVPEVGQTLEAAWTPIAQKHVDLLVQGGRIDAAAGKLVMAGFRTIMVGMNLLENRYPQIRSHRDLMAGAVSGFTDGFFVEFDVGCDVCRGLKVLAPPPCDHAVVTEVHRAAVRNNLK